MRLNDLSKFLSYLPVVPISCPLYRPCYSIPMENPQPVWNREFQKDLIMSHFERAGLLALFAFVGAPLAVGQEFKTAPAKQAQITYDEAVKKLNEEYGKGLSKLQEKYLADLDEARKAA